MLYCIQQDICCQFVNSEDGCCDRGACRFEDTDLMNIEDYEFYNQNDIKLEEEYYV